MARLGSCQHARSFPHRGNVRLALPEVLAGLASAMDRFFERAYIVPPLVDTQHLQTGHLALT